MKYYFKCPKCGSDEEFIVPESDSDGRGGGLGCLLFLVGGFIPLFIYYYLSLGKRIQCTRCYFLFRQPPLPESPVAEFSKWVIVVAVVPVFAAWLLTSMPEVIANLPSLPGVEALEKEAVAQPRLIAYLLVAIILSVIVTCFLAQLISNSRLRNELSKKYILRPFTSRSLNPPIEERRMASGTSHSDEQGNVT